MAYRDDISALGADHHWDFDGDALDQIGSVNGTNSGGIFTDTAIAEDATNCWTGNGITDRVTLPTTTEINNSAQQRKAVCGWVEVTSIQAYPCVLYGEGESTTNFQFVMGYGNQLMFECTEATNFPTGLQVYGPQLVSNRVYHVCGIFLGNTQGNEVKLFVDGVEQTLADPSDRQPDTADLNSRGVGVFGDPSTTTGPVLGGSTVLQQCPQNLRLQHWVTWGDEADANLTDTEIREELFEKGMLAEETMTSGTESVMQTELDTATYANKEHPNVACCIRVPGNTGDTDFTLTADAITFDPLASVHVQYTGTATLTWRNDRDSAATIFAATNGGTVVVENETQLDLTGLQANTEVRVFEAGTTNQVSFEENVNDGLFESFTYADSVDIMIVSLNEEIIRLESVDTSVDVVLQVSQFFDRNYVNP